MVSIKNNFLKWLSLVLIIFPSCIKIPIYRTVYGYKIGSNVRIGLSWIKVGQLEIGNHVLISHFVRFKNIPEAKIGSYVTIGLGNTFTSTGEFTNLKSIAERGNRPSIVIGDHCGISILHYFDIQDSFTVGSYTTIAGKGSVFYTHYLDVDNGVQATRPIHIGRYCLLGSSVRFAPGASVADKSVIGMAAVVSTEFKDPYCLIGGNPAQVIRKLPKNAIYFTRARGWIGSYTSPPI